MRRKPGWRTPRKLDDGHRVRSSSTMTTPRGRSRSTRCAVRSVSSPGRVPGTPTRSPPQTSTTALVTSIVRRQRFSTEPPYWSVRKFVSSFKNCCLFTWRDLPCYFSFRSLFFNLVIADILYIVYRFELQLSSILSKWMAKVQWQISAKKLCNFTSVVDLRLIRRGCRNYNDYCLTPVTLHFKV